MNTTPKLLALALFAFTPALAAPGDLDPTFGGTGRVTTAFPTDDDDIGRCVAIQSDGKIVVAGSSFTGSDYDFALARYHADGTLDTTFGGTGLVTTGIGGSHDFANAIAIQTDGRIVAVGQTLDGSDYDFAAVRYNTDGTLDTTFGGTGKVTTDFGTTQDIAAGVAIQGDGRIVLAGNAHTAVAGDVALVRYLADGSLDTTFAGTGKVTTDLGARDAASSVAVQGDGRIVVAGSTSTSTGSRIAVVRYAAGGTLDTSFGGTGKVTADVFAGRAFEGGGKVAVLATGKILVAAFVSDGGAGNDFGLVRYAADGSLDASFGSAGGVSTDLGSGSEDYPGSMAVQSDGRIVLAGVSRIGGDSFFALARYEGDGTLDGTFGTVGKVLTPMGSPDDEELGVALQSDGKIVLAGVTESALDDDFTVLRYEGGPADADGDGIASAEEDVNANGNLLDDDTDGDGIANYLDADDDGDTVPTISELPISKDSDGDGLVDYLDADDDEDGIPTVNEDTNANGSVLDDDDDGDGTPDYLDADAVVVDPTHTARFRKGVAVPGAGVDAYIPAGATWFSFGVPAINGQGKLAYIGKWKNATGSTMGTYGAGLFVDGELKVSLGQGATLLPGVTFKAFKDPVIAADSAAIAFPATLAGTGVLPANDTSLWWQPASGALTLLAREGTAAVGGGTWKGFASLALPGGATGPIFVGSLVQGAGGIDATKDMGVWAVDSTGALRLLFREGDTIDGGVVKSFVLLKAVAGSPGASRAFNSAAEISWRATFTDGSSALMVTTVP